ncbi:MAG: hypothetical protein ACE5I3_10610, partial [Phycisphaerae bacterium]
RDVAEPCRVIALLERAAPRLSAEGLVVFRQAASRKLSVDAPRSLKCVDERTFGRMRILLLQRSDDADQSPER